MAAILWPFFVPLNFTKPSQQYNTPKEIETSVKDLIEFYYIKEGQKLPIDWGKTLPESLRMCLFSLCHFLLKIRLHSYHLEKG